MKPEALFLTKDGVYVCQEDSVWLPGVRGPGSLEHNSAGAVYRHGTCELKHWYSSKAAAMQTEEYNFAHAVCETS